MKNSILLSYIALGTVLQTGVAQTLPTLRAAKLMTYDQKAILKIELRNTPTDAIELARAVVFLLDDSGRVVGQETRWIVGGAKARLELAPDGKRP